MSDTTAIQPMPQLLNSATRTGTDGETVPPPTGTMPPAAAGGINGSGSPLPFRGSVSQRSIPIPRPSSRRLQVYAFDPSVGMEMETAVVNRVVVNVPWEEPLDFGPVGEYLEVVDIDPASGCAYEPVDLNDPYLLASDGLSPSDGNPQFHQQMVYAVAMTTIRNFENALGRLALWSPRRWEEEPDDKKQYVPRLRIYPHGLREANAYYSPRKKALLFGYFPASTDDPGNHLPGGTVFTCLSHDVVAHETTHALLDGMHRRFNEASNVDSLAFHEAFADICALFQHFSLPDVLRQQIARTRGDLASQSLLGQLAQEFGQATGQHGALRDALGAIDPATGQWRPTPPDPSAITTTLEPHARGALLVAAIFDAFLSIYKSQIADLLRIATNGTGVLPAGEIHPDLVNRLANEAANSARHILNICIRALDYCPPVDLTFGDYLRALITADYDLVPNDTRNYRIAIIEGFRRRGIYPREMRTLSVDSLRWQKPLAVSNHSDLLPLPDGFYNDVVRWNLKNNRKEIYDLMQQKKAELHEWFFGANGKALGPERESQMGLDFSRESAAPGAPFRYPVEVHSVRPARRIGPNGQTVLNIVIEITQRRPEFLTPPANAAPPDFYFRGGCTLIVGGSPDDPDSDGIGASPDEAEADTAGIAARKQAAEERRAAGKVYYFIAKNIKSARRLAAQRQFLGGTAGCDALYALYFGNPYRESHSEPFALLHRGIVGEEAR